MDKLKFYRQRINSLDKKLIKILHKRLNISEKVAEYKNQKGYEIFQEDREKELIKSRKKQGLKYNIDEEHIDEIFNAILKESRKKQKQTINKNKGE